MTYDASDRKSIRAAEKAQAIASRERLQFLQACMDTIPGRAWFHDLLESCALFSVNPAFSAPVDYFTLGQRNVGMRIFAEITTHCPDQYLLMMKEANVRSHLAAARQQPRSPNGDGGTAEPIADAEPDLFGDPDDERWEYGAAN